MKRREFLQGIGATVALAAVPGAALAAGARVGVRRAAGAVMLRRTDEGLVPWGEEMPAGARIEGGDLKLWLERPVNFSPAGPVTIAGIEWRYSFATWPAGLGQICRREFPALHLRPGDTLRVS